MDAKHVTAFNDMLLHDANDILVMNPRLKSLFVASIEKFWFKAWNAFFFSKLNALILMRYSLMLNMQMV